MNHQCRQPSGIPISTQFILGCQPATSNYHITFPPLIHKHPSLRMRASLLPLSEYQVRQILDPNGTGTPLSMRSWSSRVLDLGTLRPPHPRRSPPSRIRHQTISPLGQILITVRQRVIVSHPARSWVASRLFRSVARSWYYLTNAQNTVQSQRLRAKR